MVVDRIAGRLYLLAATPDHVRTEMESPVKLGLLLNADVPSDWPPGEYDRKAQEFFLGRMNEEGPSAAGWYVWYAMLRDATGGRSALLGTGGYLGPPDPAGAVEIGYSVSREWRGRGFAGEIVGGLVSQAFSDNRVNLIAAHASGENTPSRRVLEKAGFCETGPGNEPGTVRYELRRIWRNHSQ